MDANLATYLRLEHDCESRDEGEWVRLVYEEGDSLTYKVERAPEYQGTPMAKVTIRLHDDQPESEWETTYVSNRIDRIAAVLVV